MVFAINLKLGSRHYHMNSILRKGLGVPLFNVANAGLRIASASLVSSPEIKENDVQALANILQLLYIVVEYFSLSGQTSQSQKWLNWAERFRDSANLSQHAEKGFIQNYAETMTLMAAVMFGTKITYNAVLRGPELLFAFPMTNSTEPLSTNAEEREPLQIISSIEPRMRI